MIIETPEYQEALKDFSAIKDRPVCIFVSNNKSLSLKDRIQVRDYKPELNQEEGQILVVCFNEETREEEIHFCEFCGCSPCDCHWGDY